MMRGCVLILLVSSIFMHCLLKKAFFSLLTIFWNSGFSWMHLSLSPLLLLLFFLQLFVKPLQITTLPFCFFFFPLEWVFSLLLVQHYRPLSTFLQAYYLLGLIPWIYLSPQMHIHWGFKSYLAGLMVFPHFFSLSLHFAMRNWWSEPQLAAGLVFADCIQQSIGLQRAIYNWSCK